MLATVTFCSYRLEARGGVDHREDETHIERKSRPRRTKHPNAIINHHMIPSPDPPLPTRLRESLRGRHHMPQSQRVQVRVGLGNGDVIDVPPDRLGDPRAGEEFRVGISGRVGHVP